jgi:hypothetical protein
MAIKNLLARGIGFTAGAVSWVVTRGFGSAIAPLPAPTVSLFGTMEVVTLDFTLTVLSE